MLRQDMSPLIERCSNHLAPATADPTIAVDLPGTVPLGPQPKMRTDITRSLEALRRIHAGCIGQRHNHADSRNRHQRTADWVASSKLEAQTAQAPKRVKTGTLHAT